MSIRVGPGKCKGRCHRNPILNRDATFPSLYAHIPLKTAFVFATKREWNWHKQHMKCTYPTQGFCVLNPTQPIFHWLALGFRVGWREKFASPNAKDNNLLVYFALDDANLVSFALGDAKVPNANSFASQWNIGLRFPSFFPWLRLGRLFLLNGNIHILPLLCQF